MWGEHKQKASMNLYLKKESAGESAGKSAAAGLNEKDPVWRGSLAAEHLSAKANERGQLPFACSGRATCEHKHMCGWWPQLLQRGVVQD